MLFDFKNIGIYMMTHLIVFAFIYPLVQAETGLYIDGTTYSPAYFKSIPTDFYNTFQELSVERFFNTTAPIKDSQGNYGSNLMLLGNELFVVFFDPNILFAHITTSSILNPAVLKLDDEVSHMSTLWVPQSLVLQYIYFKGTNHCTGVLYSTLSLPDQPKPLCVPLVVSLDLLSVDKIQMKDLDSIYIFYNNHTLQQYFFNENILENVFNDVTMLSYPLVLRENAIVYDLKRDVALEPFLDGELNPLQPIHIASDTSTGAYAIQFVDGSIRGHNVDYHPSFSGSCSGEGEFCMSTYTSYVPGFLFDDELLVVQPNDASFTVAGRDYTVDVTSTRAYIQTFLFRGVEGYFLIGLDEDSKAFYNGIVSFNSVGFVLHEIPLGLVKVPSAYKDFEDIQDALIFLDFVLLHHKNGHLYSYDDIEHTFIRSGVSKCHLVSLFPPSYVCMTHDNVLFTTDINYGQVAESHEIVSEFGCHISDCSRMFLFVEGKVTHYYFASGAFVVDKYTYADKIDYSSGHILYMKDGEFYMDYENVKTCALVKDDDTRTLTIYNRNDEPLSVLHPIDKSALEGKTIKKVAQGYFMVRFLTTDGDIYSCTLNTTQEFSTPILPIENSELIKNVPICEIYVSILSSTMYMSPCNGHDIYYYGIRPNREIMIGIDGQASFYEPNVVKFLEDVPRGSKLIAVYGHLLSTFLKIDASVCDPNFCYIDEIVSDDDKLILPNSTIIVIVNPIAIEDTTVVVEIGTEIIIEDVLKVHNSTLVIHIPSQEELNSIRDGDRILIIHSENGDIDGSFDEVLLEYEKSMLDECKEITGELDQTAKEIAIVFHVKENQCLGLPIWAIILIVLGVIIVITLVVLVTIYFKKKRIKLRGNSRLTQTEMTTTNHKNKVYEPSSTSKSNPTFAS